MMDHLDGKQLLNKKLQGLMQNRYPDDLYTNILNIHSQNGSNETKLAIQMVKPPVKYHMKNLKGLL